MTIELWSVDLDDVATRPEVLQVVSPADREMSGRLSTEILRRRFIARRAATRHILGASSGLPPAELQIVRRCWYCGARDHGRPEVVGTPIEFSVSSSGGRAVVAIADTRVGVDIEIDDARGSLAPELPRTVLAPQEWALLESLPDADRARTFLQMWVAKEAVLKADGRGLSVDPRLVDTSAIITGGVGYLCLDGTTWTVQSVVPAVAAARRVHGAVAELGSMHSPSDLLSRRF